MDKTEPVSTSPQMAEIMKEECQRLGYSSMTLPSGAGHDAQILSHVAEVGMIFIPCVDGISHSPQESIDWNDLEKGANLLLHTLLKLAQ